MQRKAMTKNGTTTSKQVSNVNDDALGLGNQKGAARAFDPAAVELIGRKDARRRDCEQVAAPARRLLRKLKDSAGHGDHGA